MYYICHKARIKTFDDSQLKIEQWMCSTYCTCAKNLIDDYLIPWPNNTILKDYTILRNICAYRYIYIHIIIVNKEWGHKFEGELGREGLGFVRERGNVVIIT